MASQATGTYGFGPFRLDAVKRLLLRDQLVPLTPKCFDILMALVESRGEVISKDRLITRVWPDTFVEEGNLTYNMSILRRAIGERAGEHQYIVTVPGRGYQFVEAVKELITEHADAEATDHTGTTLAVHERGTKNPETALIRDGTARSLDESFIRASGRDRRNLMIAGAALVIAASGISFGLYKLITGIRLEPRPTEPFHVDWLQRVRESRLKCDLI